MFILHLLLWLPLTASAAEMNHDEPLVPCMIPGSGEAIIVYDALGGMTPRTSVEPLVTIHANGNIILGDPYGKGRHTKSQMEPAQIQKLLDFIIEKNSFLDIHVTSIQQRIRTEQNKNGRLFAIADAAESIIRICTGEQQKEVKFYALSHAAKQFPEIHPLQQLHAIEQELKRTASWVRIGGDKGANAVLESLNEYLVRNHPDIEPFDLTDLSTAITGEDGNLTVYFSRRGLDQQGSHRRNISVVARYPSERNKNPTISVNLE